MKKRTGIQVNKQQQRQYNEWEEEAIRKAYERIKMPFEEFARFVKKAVKGTINFFYSIFAIALYISWGPYGLFYSILELIKTINHFGEEHHGTWSLIVSIGFICACGFITVGSGLAIRNYLKENF